MKKVCGHGILRILRFLANVNDFNYLQLKFVLLVSSSPAFLFDNKVLILDSAPAPCYTVSTMKRNGRNLIALAAWNHRGAGKHANKARKGSGKGSGKAARHPKHKGRRVR